MRLHYKVPPDVESTEKPDDQAVIPKQDANTTGEELRSKAQPPVTVNQITSIISAIIESKLATLYQHARTSKRLNSGSIHQLG